MKKAPIANIVNVVTARVKQGTRLSQRLQQGGKGHRDPKRGQTSQDKAAKIDPASNWGGDLHQRWDGRGMWRWGSRDLG